MTKLYTVQVEYEYVIAVEDDELPEDVAHETFGDVRWDIDVYDVDLFTSEMQSLPAGWDARSYPYRCGGPEKRIGEILEENK